MQISRLFEMLYILLENERMSAASLARRLEVSVRTVYRDAQALSEAGIPIYTERGRNGGVCILPTCKLSRAMLDEADRRSILSSLRALAAVGADDCATLRKMTAFLGEIEPDWVQIDMSDWSGRQTAMFAMLRKAIWEQRIVAFTYRSEAGEATRRSVCPLQLWFKGRTWYLRAYCLLRGAPRTFKLTRMDAMQLVPGEFPEEAFSAEYAASESPPAPPTIAMRLRVDARMAFRVWDDFGDQQIDRQADGSFLIDAAYPDGPWIVSTILSYGEHIQVVTPESLRAQVRSALKNALALYES